MEKLEGKICLLEYYLILARITFDNCWKVMSFSISRFKCRNRQKIDIFCRNKFKLA